MQALNGATLLFIGPSNSIDNTGGTIQAIGANSEVDLYTKITGGTLSTATGGSVVLKGATLNGVTLAAGSSILVPDGYNATLQGTITNNTALSLSNHLPFGSTDLVISGDVTLSGNGSLALNASNARIYGQSASDSLTNDTNHTIQGQGQIGIAGQELNLTNQGTISANQSGGTLQISAASHTVTNNGLMNATADGTLALTGSVLNLGTIRAESGSTVNLTAAGSDTITNTGAAGLMEAAAGGTLVLTGAVLNYATIRVDNGGTLNLSNAAIDSLGGTIQLKSTGSNTDLQVNGSVVLSALGTVTLSNNSHNRIYGTGSGNDYLTNGNHTIEGAGQIGISGHGFNLINLGTIDANQSGGTLQIATSLPVNNYGLMEATGGGTLLLNGAIGNSGGTIQSDGANSLVNLNNAQVTGGTLTTSNGGTMSLTGASSSLNGVTISPGSLVTLTDGSTATLAGTITNNGTLAVSGQSANTTLMLSGSVTLTGNGSLTLSNPTLSRISAGGSDSLLNDTNHTIQGAGQIGVGIAANGFALTNQGTIDANHSGSILQVATSQTVTNTGLMEATGGGILALAGTFNNSGGIIQATGAGSTVNLGASQINGGTLTTANSGATTLAGGTLNAVTISSGSVVSMLAGSADTIVGTIVNNGTLAMNASTSNTSLALSGNVTLTGSGFLTLGNSHDRIFGPTSTETLLNDTNHTIQGAGQIGIGVSANGFALTNQGTINANQSGGTLEINTSQSVVNNGLMEATGGGTLALNGTVNNNAGATLEAGDGGTLFLKNGAAVVNNGTMLLNSAGHNTNLQFSGTVTLSGNALSLSDSPGNHIYSTGGDTLINGAGHVIQGAGVINLGGSPFTVINNGTITANASNILWVTPGTFVNNGTLEVAAGSVMHVGGLQNFANGTLTGGTYDVQGVMRLVDLCCSGGELSNNAATILLDGAQSAITDAFGVNALSALSTNQASGSFIMENGYSLLDRDQLFSNFGTFVVGQGSDFSVSLGGHPYDQISGVTQDDGTVEANVNVMGGMFEGTGTVTGGVTVSGGTLKPGDSPGTLTVQGNYIQQSNGTLQIDIAGAQSSVLDVQGSVSIAGTLELMFLGGTVVNGETFTVLEGYTSLSGMFDQIDIVGPNSQDLRAQILYGQGGSVQVEVFTPEPGTWILMAGAALLAAVLRRRMPSSEA
jgi:hypothetical protein